MDAFKKYDEETYYWLGVLFADGSGTVWNRILLKSKDLEFVEGTYVGKPVKEGRGARTVVCRVDFSDKVMRERLIALGWTKENKTTRKLPESLFHNLEGARHFMRGYFDGDGSIHKDHRKPNGWRLEMSTHSSYTNSMKKLMKAMCPSANIRRYNRKTSERLMIYNFEGVREVLRWLYADASVCPHPKIKADSVKSLIEEIL
mgnify:CR=1 FL=1